MLGATLAGQERYAEAEPLLIDGYQKMEARKGAITPPDRPYLDRALEWNVQLYRNWGKPERVLEWVQKVNASREVPPRNP